MNETKKIDGEIDCSNTDEIVCPYCGYECLDSCEMSANRDDMTCEDCDRDFIYQRHREITYSTEKI